jgi:hypothetical protein
MSNKRITKEELALQKLAVHSSLLWGLDVRPIPKEELREAIELIIRCHYEREAIKKGQKLIIVDVYKKKMTPKDQAKSIVEEFYFALPNNGYLNIGINNCSQRWAEAIKCALICVNRIIESRKEDRDFDDKLFANGEYYSPHPMYLTFWLNVIEEIKLIEEQDGKGN